VSGETAYEKAQAIAVEAGKSLDRLMRQALESASKFNAAVDVPGDGAFSWITFADLEDALDDYGIESGTFRQFVEDERGVRYDSGAVVKW
jgi:hypothetical protein